MASALSRQLARSLTIEEESRRSTPVCRVHSCVRCGAALSSSEPCSFAISAASVCRACRGQQNVLAHLPTNRAVWGAGLARIRRA